MAESSEEPDWARPVVHWDLQARDPEAQRTFYATLFNWEIGEGFVMAIPPGVGGPLPGPGGHIITGEPGFAVYVQVRDLRATLVRTTELGGTVTGEPFDVPGGPTIAPIADPEGNRLVLVQQ